MRVLALLIVLAALGAGFAIGMMEPRTATEIRASVPVRQQLRFDRGGATKLLEKGWGATQRWGTPMAAERTGVLLGFDGPARGDVELLIEARAQKQAGSSRTLIIRFNDAELGRWSFGRDVTQTRRRFVVPKAVFNKDTVGHLSFEYADGVDDPSGLGLVSLTLHDLNRRPGAKGFVDRCSTESIVGWAVVDNVGSAVVAKVNGQPIVLRFIGAPRSDLARNGLPPDAGFELIPSEPIPPGSKIEVTLPDGRPLRGSPCQL